MTSPLENIQKLLDETIDWGKEITPDEWYLWGYVDGFLGEHPASFELEELQRDPVSKASYEQGVADGRGDKTRPN